MITPELLALFGAVELRAAVLQGGATPVTRPGSHLQGFALFDRSILSFLSALF